MQEVDSHVLRREEFSGTVEERLDKVIFYTVRHADIQTHLARRQNSLSDRLQKLEELSHLRAIAEAREDERDKRLADKLEAMTASIKATNDEVSKLKAIGAKALWIFAGALLLAAARWVLAGGLNGVQ